MKPDIALIESIKGIGSARAKQLNRLGISTVYDLLTYFPHRFEDRRKVSSIFSLEDGTVTCVNGIVISKPEEHFVRKGMVYYKMQIRDDSGIMTCTFFNNKYIKNAFTVGREYTFYGKVSVRGKNKDISSPEFEPSSQSNNTKCIVPVYPLTSGITQKFLRAVLLSCYEKFHLYLNDPIPQSIAKENSLCSLDFAIKNIHFPQDLNSLEIAKKRLVFEEFFLLQASLRRLKTSSNDKKGIAFKISDVNEFLDILPFSLTNAQKNVLKEIAVDMSSGKLMNRLVQGDVGSGKTVIAAAAIYICVKNGYQAAMMAPTEVLAKQHYKDLSFFLDKLNIKTALLTGSSTVKEKKEVYEGLESGSIQAVFGTHALITDKVKFSSLALAVTDEQHRFGVRQRMQLSDKGLFTHTLVMTATPIPRTLALIMYGDMDISVIDELPPGRQHIDTFCVGENMRDRINAFIRREVASDNQVYIVCPAVEENEETNLKSAQEVYSKLSSTVFEDIPMGLIHGKMKSSEKEQAMHDFVSCKTKILVSTTVIEVGVNVPTATLMIIEDAERFGLSQLHQLRGRVGRGKSKSYCVLFCSSFSEEIKKRMEIMVKSESGFEISEVDLSLRGPGDFFGTRQHGVFNLKIADFANDMNVLKQSGIAAEKLLSKDPELESEENFYIRTYTDNLMKKLTL